MKNYLLLIYCLFGFSISIAAQELIKIEGKTQGTTYHISYYDIQNRNFQPEIEKLLLEFDFSVSIIILNQSFQGSMPTIRMSS